MSALPPLEPEPAPVLNPLGARRELLPHRVLLRRVALAFGAVAVVAAGLWARTGLAGAAGDVAGGILYAVLIYLLLAFVAPRARCRTIAAAAVVLCAGIELFQLTPWPARWADLWPPLRLVFGTTFNAWDLPAYAAGGFAAGIADHLLRRVSASRRR